MIFRELKNLRFLSDYWSQLYCYFWTFSLLSSTHFGVESVSSVRKIFSSVYEPPVIIGAILIALWELTVNATSPTPFSIWVRRNSTFVAVSFSRICSFRRGNPLLRRSLDGSLDCDFAFSIIRCENSRIRGGVEASVTSSHRHIVTPITSFTDSLSTRAIQKIRALYKKKCWKPTPLALPPFPFERPRRKTNLVSQIDTYELRLNSVNLVGRVIPRSKEEFTGN